MDDQFLGHELEEWYPMEPQYGPPLPRFLNIYWPWYKAPTPPTPGLASLYGKVTDSATGAAIPSAAVSLDSVSGATDASGNYQFLNFSPGTYSVTASKEGYLTQATSVTLAEGTNQLNIALQPTEVPPLGADIRLENLNISPAEVQVGLAVTISVTVKNYGTQAGTKLVTCKVDGGTATQEVSLEPGQSQNLSFQSVPTEAKTYQVTVDGLTGSFTATGGPLPGKANLYGVVTDFQTGKPISGVQVTPEVGIPIFTDARGYYEFLNIGSEPFPFGIKLLFKNDGYNDKTLIAALYEGNNEINVEMVPVTVPPPENWVYSNFQAHYNPSDLHIYLSADITGGGPVSDKNVALWERWVLTTPGYSHPNEKWHESFDDETMLAVGPGGISLVPGETYHWDARYGGVYRFPNMWPWLILAGATIKLQLRDSDGGQSEVVSIVAR